MNLCYPRLVTKPIYLTNLKTPLTKKRILLFIPKKIVILLCITTQLNIVVSGV